MAYFERIVRKFSVRICWIAIVALFAMMMLTVSDVILRAFGSPIIGCYEVVTFLSAVVIGFPIAYTQIQRVHIAIEFVVMRFTRKAQKIVDAVAHFLSIGVFAVLAWQVSRLGVKFWTIGQVSETLELPFFPFVWGVAFGCAVMTLILIIDFYNSIIEAARK